MANKIKVKRGKEVNLPILDVAEPAFTTDTKKPFIGSDEGNVELATKEYIDGQVDTIVANATVDSEVILARDGKTTLNDRLEADKTEVLSELSNLATQKADKLKVATIEKELNDFQKTLAQVNVNQEAKQNVTGYGVVSLPKNCANGQVSSVVKGNTIINKAGDTSPQTITLNSTKTYLLIKTDGGTVNIDGVDTAVPTKITGKTSITLTWTTGKIGLYELLPTETGLATDLAKKYTYVSSAKSTISAGRIASKNKNEINDSVLWEQGTYTSIGLKGESVNIIRTKSFIKAKEENIAYTFSVSSGYRAYSISEYDVNYQHIRTTFANTTFNTITRAINTVYVTLSAGKYPSNITSVSDLILIKPQLEEGTVATPYEPYTESTQYFTAKDSNGNIVELRSLPNGTKDEVRPTEGKKYQRVSEKILQETDFNRLYTGFTDVDILEFKTITDMITVSSIPNDAINLIGLEQVAYSDRQLVSSIGKYYINSVVNPNIIAYVVTKGTSFTDAKNQLISKTLIYQLAVPIITPIEVSGNLISYPSGTIYVENAVADAGIYTDKFAILQQDLPIKEIEKISKVDFVTGVETQLDVTKAVMAGDKKSFTHPNLTANDIVFTTYFFDKESTLGEMTVEYYDSRHVLKDSVTGKFYKVVPTVANGVLTNGLVEV